MSVVVAFVAESPTGVLLPYVAVDITDGSGTVVASGNYGPYHVGQPVRTSSLSPGTYYAHARCEGYIFEYLEEFDIPDIESSADDPYIVTFIAESTSVPAGGPAVVQVYGWVPKEAPGYTDTSLFISGPATRLATHSDMRRDLPLNVAFTRCDASGKILRESSITRVTSDQNGYFEAILAQGAVYRATIPGLRGAKYIVTPSDPGAYPVSSLIDASISASPFSVSL